MSDGHNNREAVMEWNGFERLKQRYDAAVEEVKRTQSKIAQAIECAEYSSAAVMLSEFERQLVALNKLANLLADKLPA